MKCTKREPRTGKSRWIFIRKAPKLSCPIDVRSGQILSDKGTEKHFIDVLFFLASKIHCQSPVQILQLHFRHHLFQSKLSRKGDIEREMAYFADLATLTRSKCIIGETDWSLFPILKHLRRVLFLLKRVSSNCWRYTTCQRGRQIRRTCFDSPDVRSLAFMIGCGWNGMEKPSWKMNEEMMRNKTAKTFWERTRKKPMML